MKQTNHEPETFEEQAIGLVDAMYERSCEFPIASQGGAAVAAAESASSAASIACILLTMAGDEDISETVRDMLMDCAKDVSGAAMNAMRVTSYLVPNDDRDDGMIGKIDAIIHEIDKVEQDESNHCDARGIEWATLAYRVRNMLEGLRADAAAA